MNQTKRITFNEITKTAILKAIENPRLIDENLVNAQQARRILDRLVGYELSPVLWRKVKGGLSAGRVQSVAVRLIVEKEREIQEFNPKGLFKSQAVFVTKDGKKIKAQLQKNIKNKESADLALDQIKKSNFTITKIETKRVKRNPLAPFTTSTLQQEASRVLGFNVSRTMSVAQRLYESGRITYMRTDSVNLSQEARNTAAQEIS